MGEDDDDTGDDGAVVEGCTDTAEAQGMMDPAGIIIMKSRRKRAALRSVKAKMAFFHNFILEQRGALKRYKTKKRRPDIRHHYIKPRPTQYQTVSFQGISGYTIQMLGINV